MKLSIKLKFTIGLSVILIITGIVLNLIINKVLQVNFENSVKSSMNDIMINSREYINYRLTYKNLVISSESFENEAGDISDYLLSAFSCENQVLDMKGNILENSSRLPESALTKAAAKTAAQGKAIVRLSYTNSTAAGTLAFPLYLKNDYIGIIIINKNFTELYNYNNRTMYIITIVEILVFMIIFILSFMYIAYIIKPLRLLADGLKSVGAGNYATNLLVKGKDEIGRLSSEFNDMRLKIQNQVQIINEEKDKVLKLEGSRREFFNNVTHELKTPLTAISGYAQMLMDKELKDNEFKARAIQRIYLESERMHKLVLDLIEVSRGAAYINADKKIIHMSELLIEICRDMKIKAEKYQVSLIENITEGVIFGEEDKIRQLVINITDNAIKYSYTNGKVFVKAFNENDYYVIQVTNRGEAIETQLIKNIFEPFVKGNKTVEKGSSGLGLYICNEIVNEHNGQIYIENGEEIKVTVKIPSCGNNLETS